MQKEFLKNLTLEFFIEWGSTALLIVGVLLASFNFFPLYLWFGLASNLGWLVIAAMWRKPSLIVVELVVVAIYIVGLIKYFISSFV